MRTLLYMALMRRRRLLADYHEQAQVIEKLCAEREQLHRAVEALELELVELIDENAGLRDSLDAAQQRSPIAVLKELKQHCAVPGHNNTDLGVMQHLLLHTNWAS
jgi:cell division protein FtsB